jgi:hypothetical protein
MTDRAILLALAERCEQAAGPDASLDFAIALAAGYRFEKAKFEKRKWWRDPKGVRCSALATDGPPPRFTASLDAAVTLVPEGWGWAVSTTGAGPPCAYGHPPAKGLAVSWIDDTPAATSALAICAFALRARATAQPSSDT